MKPTYRNRDELVASMKERLGKMITPEEVEIKADLILEIEEAKKARNAVILGHNYMESAVYLYASDIRGDSLELCRKAQETDADVIVFCGVKFMAESAKILNPSKKVLIPSLEAGCSLAESITAEDVRKLKEEYPGIPVMTYINTYADVKAETDICCTSSNAEKIVRAMDADQIIFLPDEFMAANLARDTGKRLISLKGEASPEKSSSTSTHVEQTILSWDGKCEVHEKFTAKDIENARKQFPDVVVLAHPECPPEVTVASDFSGSTSAMINYVKENQAPHYLLLTECAMGDNIIAENPEKEILRLCSVRCPHMGQITLEQTLASLKELRYETEVPEEVRIRAKLPIDRMLEFSSTGRLNLN